MNQLILARGDDVKAVDLPADFFETDDAEKAKTALVEALNQLLWAFALGVQNKKPGA